MKVLVTLVRILVGLLFIFSGLVKANDPLGLSYKMQEFFELWDMSQFDRYTLALSVLMNAFEIIAGFALLLGWRIRLFIWLLLLLILFFTFLTGYTYVTGKPTNCGCFGDCLVISSKASFLKDLVLTILISFLFWKQRLITPLFSAKANALVMVLVAVFSFGLQWFALTYLPVVDCLPYKKGNNIQEKMQMPANAIPDSTVITFVYEKDGKEVEFTADKFPADFKTPPYTFKNRYDKVVRKGKNNEPPIKGFALSGESGIDSTQVVLDHDYAVLLFLENFSVPISKWKGDFEKIYQTAIAKNIPVYAIVTSRVEAMKNFSGTAFAGIPIFKCDYTAIRTAARTSPAIYFLQKGTIRGKWSYKTMDGLIKQLDSVNMPARIQVPTGSDTAINPQPGASQ